MANPEEVQGLVDRVLSEWGKIDILVNNAAIHEPKPVLETSLDDWNKTLTVNLASVFLCCKAVLKSMLCSGGGKIINISSGAGSRGFPGNAAYSASKGAINAFSQALAGEVRKNGIAVNVLSPAHVDTEMHRQTKEDNPLVAADDFMSIEDVVNTALFLASDSGSISAQVFHVRNTDRW